MKKWFKYFLILSLVFLIINLIREDYLNVPKVYRFSTIFLSLLLLFAGFVFDAISWGKVINNTQYKTSYKRAIASMGLFVFGKYMPGKIWVILGRGEYIANNYHYSRKDISSFSINAQLLSLWAGLFLGTVGMIAINEISVYGLSVLVLFLVLSLTIFTPFFHNIGEYILSKIFKKPISIPKLSFPNAIKVLPWFILNWGLWCVSFYFLAHSLMAQEVPFNMAWGFGLAGSLGIMAVIAPGGIGVREGLLTGYLTLAGIDLQNATTIAVASRLWFLIGEVFIFLVALVIEKTSKPVSATPPVNQQ